MFEPAQRRHVSARDNESNGLRIIASLERRFTCRDRRTRRRKDLSRARRERIPCPRLSNLILIPSSFSKFLCNYDRANSLRKRFDLFSGVMVNY